MVRYGLVAVLLSLFAVFAVARASPEAREQTYPNVTVYEARSIITMEPGYPEARFVATSEGIILGVAQELEDLSAWTDGRNVTVDRSFADDVLMPGFVEPHIHPMQTVMMLPRSAIHFLVRFSTLMSSL